MRARSLVYQAPTTTNNYSRTGALLSSSTAYYPKREETFTFSGFGSNDKRRKSAPTAGSYDLSIRSTNSGWRRSMRYYYGEYDGYVHQFGQTGNFDVNSAAYPVAFDSNVYNDTLSKLYEKIKDSDLNLAVSLGEYRETATMVNRATRAMYELIRTARGVKRKLLTQPSKVFADVWLSYKYGWLPLYQDVFGLLDFTSRTFETTTFKARSSRTTQINSTAGSLTSYNDGKRSDKGVYKQKVEISVTASVDDTIAFDRTRITSLNPVGIAWELVPFSFVVDWFYDVGGYLALQEAALGSGLKFHRGYVTKVALVDVQRKYELRDALANNYPTMQYVTHYSESSLYRVIKNRTVLTAFPRPERPRLKVSLGSQRILSAAALFRNVILGKH